MKHKKFICLSLASLFALSMVGFAACGDSDNGGNNTGDESGNTGNTGGNTGGSGGGNADEEIKVDRTAAAFGDAAATFKLDGRSNTAPRNIISDTLFGVFLEDINYAGYLLDDNLVYNGSFESLTGSKTVGWATGANATIAAASTGGVLSGEQYYGERGVNANYANVTVTAANGVISNKGHNFVPIAVEKDAKYIFSAFIKTATATVMTVRIRDNNAVYCEADLNVQSGEEWVKYEQTLTVSATASENVRLELSFADAGTYSIDAVSLETQHATGGIKQYVFDAIKELGPKFVRFPGGCIIEGDGGNGGADTQEVYDWKNSVGAVQTGDNAGDDTIPAFEYKLVKDGKETTATTYGEWLTRRQNADLWGYDMEYGVGFYEYFLLCDNLGASAVPVVNCGLTCQGGAASNPSKLNGRHNQKVNDYIQDAIDLIEFAKGDTSTKWGAIRANLGHPAPFEMDYIGIGNEQSGDKYYQDCYWEFLKSEAFQAALEKYNVKPIVGNAPALGDCEDYENGLQMSKGTAQKAAEAARAANVVNTVSEFGVVDQHYYVNYTVLFQRHNMYYDYARPDVDPDNYYEIFVGEYSANGGEGDPAGYATVQNSLMAALSEAAMMTTYENNGDIIKLAAYAPMFGVANTDPQPRTGGANNQWPVDMMYYTNNTIVRTANYYVQRLFMQNQGKYRLPFAELNYAEGVEQQYALPTDSGLGTQISIDKLYTVASKAADGSLILKVVNASPDAIKFNINISNAETKGYAYLTELYDTASDPKAFNSLVETRISTADETVGFTGSSLGQELKPYSVTVLRFPVK